MVKTLSFAGGRMGLTRLKTLPKARKEPNVHVELPGDGRMFSALNFNKLLPKLLLEEVKRCKNFHFRYYLQCDQAKNACAKHFIRYLVLTELL